MFVNKKVLIDFVLIVWSIHQRLPILNWLI